MPKFTHYYKDKEKTKRKRYRDRLKNYKKGRFGNRQQEPFDDEEIKMIILHELPDIALARMFGSSTNGIQVMRWRLKNNYLNMYKNKSKR